MGTKVTSSSGSVLEEPEIQKLQMQAKIFKENSLNKLNALKSTTQLLERQTFSGCLLYQQAFAQLFGNNHQEHELIEQCIIERASHEQELKMTLKKLSERQLQIQQCKELEAHYGFMAKIQEVLPAESSSTDTPLEQIHRTQHVLIIETSQSRKHDKSESVSYCLTD
ncbi:hypothetical protein Tco_0640008 [Tanacetum coccineum]